MEGLGAAVRLFVCITSTGFGRRVCTSKGKTKATVSLSPPLPLSQRPFAIVNVHFTLISLGGGRRGRVPTWRWWCCSWRRYRPTRNSTCSSTISRRSIILLQLLCLPLFECFRVDVVSIRSPVGYVFHSKMIRWEVCQFRTFGGWGLKAAKYKSMEKTRQERRDAPVSAVVPTSSRCGIRF